MPLERTSLKILGFILLTLSLQFPLMRNEARTEDFQGTIKLGGNGGAYGGMAQVAAAFQKRYPNVSFDFSPSLGPLGYFILEYQRLSIILETEAEANALFASQIINTNPEYWPFEHKRIHEFLSRRLNKTDRELRRIIDLKGETIAPHQDEVRYPFIVRSHNLYDCGTVVGKLEIVRSLHPSLWKSILVGVFGCLLIATIYLVLRKFVLSAREEAEKALRESEKRFRDIADNASEWIWEVDAQGKYLYASSAVEKLLGFKPEEVLNKHFYHLFHPDDREEFKEKALAVFATKQPFNEFLNRNLHKNGQEVWLATSGLPVMDEKGELIGYRGADTDITARRQAEEALKESEKKYRLLAENISDVIWTMNLNLEMTYVSPSAELLRGYTAQETVRQKLEEILTPASLDLALRTYAEALNFAQQENKDRNRIWSLDLEQNCKDGSTIWAEVHARLMYDDAGRPTGILGVTRDITARKRAEEKVQQYKEHLEKMVEERTGQLTRANAQLNLEIIERQRTAEKLQTSLNEKEALLREIHHRVKNNLQLISSLLNLQATYQGEKDSRKVFAESENRIRSLALIHESLYSSKDFSRIEFTAYLRELLVHLQQAYKIPGQSINCAVEGNEIYLDITQAIPCGLIVNELVSNALKHAFPGGREGEILMTIKREGDLIFLSVKDNGVGLPPDVNLQDKGRLGLQIVTTLINQLGGIINYTRNGGTEFTMEF